MTTFAHAHAHAPAHALDLPVPGLFATGASPLPFAPDLVIRAFLLQRSRGNVLLYGAPASPADAAAVAALGGTSRRYLGHWHEASFLADEGPGEPAVPVFAHEADADAIAHHHRVRATFSRRHLLDDDLDIIPMPGHTPGATAFLWTTDEHRLLFTGDTVYLRDGEWVAAVLSGSDRERYVETLELLRGLDFDVLVPWAASAGHPPYAVTGTDDARRRIGAILQRVRAGGDH